MPKLSAKQRKLRELREIIAQREAAAIDREILSDEDSGEDELDEYWEIEYLRAQGETHCRWYVGGCVESLAISFCDADNEKPGHRIWLFRKNAGSSCSGSTWSYNNHFPLIVRSSLTSHLVPVSSSVSGGTRARYGARASHYRRRKTKWPKILHNHQHTSDSEFLKHFRLQRPEFFRLVALVKDDPVFKTKGGKPFKGGVCLHLMVLLKFLGAYGNANTALDIGKFLGFAEGGFYNYLDRAVSSILKLEESTITWPNAIERREIAHRMKANYGFVNCVGITDGTLLPLATKPRHNGEDYYSRKSSYAVNALVTCDDIARVRNVVIGWPGSVHDNRVWSNSPVCQNPDLHFEHNEYLLGDSAFQASRTMIPAYKKPPKADMHPSNSYFNNQLAKARIKSEHCIGLLKMRFQYLHEVRVELGKKRKHMRRLIRYVKCACIIHNLLVAQPVPEEWRAELDSYITGELDEDDELNAPVPAGASGDERRNQLLAYMLEIRTQR